MTGQERRGTRDQMHRDGTLWYYFVRWCTPTDRKRLAHVPDEDSGADRLDADAGALRDDDYEEGGGLAGCPAHWSVSETIAGKTCFDLLVVLMLVLILST